MISKKFRPKGVGDDKSFIRSGAVSLRDGVIYQEVEKGLKIIFAPDVGGVWFSYRAWGARKKREPVD